MRKTLGLVNFSVDKRVTITMLILIVMVFGYISFSRLGLDMFPDITFPMVSVVTQYPGVAPEEVEQFVTEPLEGVIAGVNGVKKMTSNSAEGVSAINVEFEWGTNLDYGAQDIKDNIDFVRDFLPTDVKEPVVFKFNLSQIPIIFMGVQGMKNTYELREFLLDNVVERLQRLDGVAQAAVFGGEEKEIHVLLDPARLRLKNVSPDEVLRILPAQNMNMPAGYHVSKQTDYLLRSLGEFKSIDDIRNAMVGATADGTPVRVQDVAEVRETFREKRNSTQMDRAESVFLIINKRSGANTLQVSKRINKELGALKNIYPQISFTSIFDQGKPVERVSKSASLNALIGGVLAILFMWVFLMSIRPTLIIAVAIPLSIVTTFIALKLAGYTLNLMTLGGLALGVGMLVDNSVVVIENIYRRLESGESRNDAAKNGASQVAMAITASTFTTIVVFLPIVFSEGITGQLTRGMSLTIMFSLFASLLVSLTMVPMLASVFFVKKENAGKKDWFTPVREAYVKSLSWVLDNPWKTVFALALVFALTIGAARFVGTEFMPEADNSMFVLYVDLPVGTPLPESKRVASRISDLFKEFPEIISIGEFVGRDESDRGGDQASIAGPHSIQYFVKLCDVADRKRSTLQIQDVIRDRMPKLRDARIRFMGMNMMGGSGKPVKVNVYGKDLATLSEICDKVATVMRSVNGLKDVESSFSKGRPEYHITIDRQKALMYGLAPAQIQSVLEIANLGKVATRLRTGDDEVEIRVILDTQHRSRIDQLLDTPLKTPLGATIPLSQVVTASLKEGPTIISRDNKFRAGTVDANLSDIPLGVAVKEVKTKLAPLQKSLPSGYTIEFKGQFEDMQESFGQLFLGLMLAIVLVYMVMASQFESLVHPFIIMFTMPLAVIGVVWIMLLTGSTFSVVVFVGCIILAGIVVNNGIVLIDFVNQLRSEGKPLRDALLEAARSRIRPILITAGTTVVGTLPMAISRAEGSEMQAPLALTIIGGLTTSTILTLYLVPLVYGALDKVRTSVKRKVKEVIH